jgi:stearoyl-CoA desaturase (delta-9 desaturase)
VALAAAPSGCTATPTHGAYPFKNAFFRELCRNLVIKIVVDEAYVISHHVHHRLVEEAGGPVQR